MVGRFSLILPFFNFFHTVTRRNLLAVGKIYWRLLRRESGGWQALVKTASSRQPMGEQGCTQLRARNRSPPKSPRTLSTRRKLDSFIRQVTGSHSEQLNLADCNSQAVKAEFSNLSLYADNIVSSRQAMVCGCREKICEPFSPRSSCALLGALSDGKKVAW